MMISPLSACTKASIWAAPAIANRSAAIVIHCFAAAMISGGKNSGGGGVTAMASAGPGEVTPEAWAPSEV